ncbi:M48 family metallopeptidase [Roseovarius sp. MMSF_3281]|uniref:M48 family metallopeptidase n=1 Tax=Roseovarius sp. MMSF_3281 TaxID=3046694 RepID=UPI00273FB34B|nr:SprT family zinc-dependent metalloprotease [Roseovarius sp. MMSF_3281]
MGQHVIPGDPPIDLTLRRSGRARRISLRVSGLDGKVTLTLPHGVPEHEALDFARKKQGWLRRQLDKRPEHQSIGMGEDLPFQGMPHRIAPGPGRRIMARDGMLHVPGPESSLAPRLQAWLKAQARDRLAAASDHYAAKLGRPYARLTLRDTRSRWGSCSSTGGLMYSWRLIMAPAPVLDYVAAHEVAHLAEMNHSPAFWATVDRLCPGYEPHRRWLREHGAGLHAYRFGD